MVALNRLRRWSKLLLIDNLHRHLAERPVLTGTDLLVHRLVGLLESHVLRQVADFAHSWTGRRQ